MGESRARSTVVRRIAKKPAIGSRTDVRGRASVVAMRHSTAYRLNRQALEEMRQREPEIAWAFLMDIARSLSQRARGLLAKQAGL